MKVTVIVLMLMILVAPAVAPVVSHGNVPSSGLVSTGCKVGYDYCKTGAYYTTNMKKNPTNSDAIRVDVGSNYLTIKPSEIFYTDGETEQNVSDIQSVTGKLTKYGTLNNAVIKYDNAFGKGVTLEYVWTPNKLLKLLEITSYEDLPRVNTSALDIETTKLVFRETIDMNPNLDVYINGKKWDKEKKETTDQAVELRNGKTTVLTLPAPYIKDANGNYKKLNYVLRKKDGKLKITIEVPWVYLYEATYPIIIDPQVQTAVGGLTSTESDNQRKIIRDSTTQIHVVYDDVAAGWAEYSNSTTGGATWNGNDIIAPGCSHPALDVLNTDDLLVACGADDTYFTAAPGYTPWVSTTGAPFLTGTYPDVDLGAITNLGVIAESVGGVLTYWEAGFPYAAWGAFTPLGGIPAADGSTDIAIDATEQWVCIGYQVPGANTFDVTCCNAGGLTGVCVLPGSWSIPVTIGVADTVAGSCSFDSGGVFHCAYVNAGQIRINSYNPGPAAVGTETVLDPGAKMVCNMPSLSTDSATEQYASMMCDDGTRGGMNDIFVANRSTAKHWGYPQKESTWITDPNEDLAFPASPANFGVFITNFEWIYTLNNISAGVHDVEYDNAPWAAPTTTFCGGSYGGGDWLVVNPTLCENETIYLDNDSSLTINDRLVFNNVTLRVCGFEDNDDSIIINSGGEFLINDTYDYSEVTQGYCPQCYYVFNAETGSVLSVNGSTVNYAGSSTSVTSPFRNSGIWINTSNTFFVNASISGLVGISFYGTTAQGTSNHLINRTVINANGRDGIYGVNVSSSIFDLGDYNAIASSDGIELLNSWNNEITNCDSEGIRLRSVSYHNTVRNCSAHSSSAGIVLVTDSDYNNITNNTARNAASFHGINLDSGCGHNIIRDNVVFGNPDEGIYLHNNNDYNQLINNTVYSNTDHGIILDDGEDYNVIENNTIYLAGSEGIYIDSSSDRNNITGNNISTSTNINVYDATNSYNFYVNNLIASGSGIGAYTTNSNHLLFENNTITGNAGHGLQMDSTTYSTVENNTIYQHTGHSVYLFNSNWNTMRNNTLENMTNYGLYMRDSDNNTVDINDIRNGTTGINCNSHDNNISSNAVQNMTIVGIYFVGANYNMVDGNAVFNQTGMGIYVTGGTQNMVQHNTIGNASHGLDILNGATFNTFLNNTIYNCTLGLNVSNANITNHYFANSSISNSTNYDVGLDTNSQVTLLNVTFNKTNTTIIDTSVLTRRWYVDAQTVWNSNYLPAGGVTVTIDELDTTNVYSGITDSTGHTSWQTLREYYENSSSLIYTTNHSFDGILTLGASVYTGANTSNVSTNDVGSVIIALSPTGTVPSPGPPGPTTDKLWREVTFNVTPKGDFTLKYKDHLLDTTRTATVPSGYVLKVEPGRYYTFTVIKEGYEQWEYTAQVPADTTYDITLEPIPGDVQNTGLWASFKAIMREGLAIVIGALLIMFGLLGPEKRWWHTLLVLAGALTILIFIVLQW